MDARNRASRRSSGQDDGAVVPTEVVVIKTEAPDSFEEDESDSETINPDLMVPMTEMDEGSDDSEGATTNGRNQFVERYSCDRCDYKNDDPSEVAKHRVIEHLAGEEEEEEDVDDGAGEGDDGKDDGATDKPYACSYCDYSTVYPTNLSDHMRTHSKALKCHDCAGQFTTPAELAAHRHAIHGASPPGTGGGERPYRCAFCAYSTSVKGSLRSHVRVHTGERPYACTQCSYKARTSSGLASHRSTVHSVNRPYACSLCDGAYRTAYPNSLVAHVRAHRGERPHACPECPYRGVTTAQLSTHYKATHGDDVPRYSCTECDYTTRLKSSLNAHVKTHTEHVSALGCHLQPVTAGNQESLKLKMASKRQKTFYKNKKQETTEIGADQDKSNAGDREKKFRCDQCSYKTAHKGALIAHKKIHRRGGVVRVRSEVEPQEHACQLCDYRTPFTDDLILHNDTVHKGTGAAKGRRRRRGGAAAAQPAGAGAGAAAAYSCDLCDYKSPHKSKVSLHRMTHTGEKPYACDLCDYRSSQVGHLTQHRMTHTGQKPYACTECDYRTAYSSNLAQHKLRHQGARPFRCHVCGYSATCSSNLTRHAKMHVRHAVQLVVDHADGGDTQREPDDDAAAQ